MKITNHLVGLVTCYQGGSSIQGWQTVQAAQVKIAETMENVYCVKSADVCEDNDIHPATKVHLGKRIAHKILELR